MSANGVEADLDNMRRQILRQRRDIDKLKTAGIDSSAAKAMLDLMNVRVAALIARRNDEIWNNRPKNRGTTKWTRVTQSRA